MTKPPKPLIPVAGNHVTFPVEPEPSDQVVISWSQDGNHTYTATYYRIRCWFGEYQTENKAFNPFGESIIFVAAEYIEPRYSGPITLERHLLKIKSAKIEEWIVLILDKRFEYGQDSDKTFRWIVYHPPIGREPPRVIHQHRFGHNVAVNFSNAALTAASNFSDWRVSVPSYGFTKAFEFLKRVKGDTLHQFSSIADVEAIKKQKSTYATMPDYSVIKRDDLVADDPVTVEEKDEFEALLSALVAGHPDFESVLPTDWESHAPQWLKDRLATLTQPHHDKPTGGLPKAPSQKITKDDPKISNRGRVLKESTPGIRQEDSRATFGSEENN